MKKLVFLIPVLLLVACSNKVSETAIDKNNEVKIEEAKETTKDLGSDIKSEVLEKKNDKDLFTFDRPIFTNPTGTKWEMTATTSCTIDLNEYPSWVKKNLDYLLEVNNDSKKQTLNTLIDLKENYEKYPDVNTDLTKDEVWGYEGAYSQKAVLYYAKGINYGGEVKVLNQNFLNSIAYADGYNCNDLNDHNINYTFKQKIVYFKDIKKYDTTGFLYYMPEINDYYADDINNYFICDLENNGRAYLCKLNMDYINYEHPCWAELDYNCMIQIMCLSPFTIGYEKLYLTCPNGYFHRIESYEELQNWAYLYASTYDKYVDISKVPNPKEKSSYNPYVTNIVYVGQTSNGCKCYAHMNGEDVKSASYCEDAKPGLYDKLFNDYGCIRKSESNKYLNEIMSIFELTWGENSIFGAHELIKFNEDVLLSVFDGRASTLYPINKLDFDNISYKNEILELLSFFGIHRHQHSVDDYGKEDITAEVVKYVNDYIIGVKGLRNMYGLHVYPERQVVIQK